jgi:hypothetical protein
MDIPMTNKTKEDTMQAYLNDPKLKKDFVKEVVHYLHTMLI